MKESRYESPRGERCLADKSVNRLPRSVTHKDGSKPVVEVEIGLSVDDINGFEPFLLIDPMLDDLVLVFHQVGIEEVQVDSTMTQDQFVNDLWIEIILMSANEQLLSQFESPDKS